MPTIRRQDCFAILLNLRRPWGAHGHGVTSPSTTDLFLLYPSPHRSPSAFLHIIVARSVAANSDNYALHIPIDSDLVRSAIDRSISYAPPMPATRIIFGPHRRPHTFLPTFTASI